MVKRACGARSVALHVKLNCVLDIATVPRHLFPEFNAHFGQITWQHTAGTEWLRSHSAKRRKEKENGPSRKKEKNGRLS